MRFEYHTSFIEMHYLEKEVGFLNKVKTTPDIEGFLSNPEVSDGMNQMGSEGWELVSVQPVLKGSVQDKLFRNVEYGFSKTYGYFMFWKRCLDG